MEGGGHGKGGEFSGLQAVSCRVVVEPNGESRKGRFVEGWLGIAIRKTLL